MAKHIEWLSPDALRPWKRNARTHSKAQIRQIAKSIETFGFTNPVLIDNDEHILAGHGRVAAAKLLGLATVPFLRIDHMSAEERRAYVLADNKLALNAVWDEDLLAQELEELQDLDLGFDVEITGFSIAEIDTLIEELHPEEPTAPHDDTPIEDAPRRHRGCLADGASTPHLRRQPRPDGGDAVDGWLARPNGLQRSAV